MSEILSNLPPFGTTKTRRKCGSNHIHTRFVSEGVPRETMRRRCVGCGYSWDEAPLDAAPTFALDERNMTPEQIQAERARRGITS